MGKEHCYHLGRVYFLHRGAFFIYKTDLGSPWGGCQQGTWEGVYFPSMSFTSKAMVWIHCIMMNCIERKCFSFHFDPPKQAHGVIFILKLQKQNYSFIILMTVQDF